MAQTILQKLDLVTEITKQPYGLVVLPLKKWQAIERDLEDLEIYRSSCFVEEIKRRRQDKKTTSLDKILKKYHLENGVAI